MKQRNFGKNYQFLYIFLLLCIGVTPPMSHSYLKQNLFAFTDKHKIFGFLTINIRLSLWSLSVNDPV